MSGSIASDATRLGAALDERRRATMLASGAVALIVRTSSTRAGTGPT